MTSLDSNRRNPPGTAMRTVLDLRLRKKSLAVLDSLDSDSKVERAKDAAPLAPEELNDGPAQAQAQPSGVTAMIGDNGGRQPARGRRRLRAMKHVRVNRIGDAIVVTFDMCSSSKVLERMTLSADLPRFHNFLLKLKQYLAAQQQEISFDVYKFTGDGWILLFPATTEGTLLLKFLHDLCVFFKDSFQKDIARFMDSVPEIVGLTIGIEKGPLARMTISGAKEYVGRALNVACRLQGAVKDRDGSPAYRALVSNRVFTEYFAKANSYKPFKVTRALRNIGEGDRFGCREFELLKVR